MIPFQIDNDIKKAETIPARFYNEDDFFQLSVDKIWKSSWQFATDSSKLQNPGDQFPYTFLPEVVNEPLLLTQDKSQQLHCLSNVCTHRAKVLVEEPTKNRLISCGYHGRCFRLDGSFKSMPCFEQVENFPSEKDNLHSYPLKSFGKLLFTSITPSIDFDQLIAPMKERLNWLDLDQLEFIEEESTDYFINAHWALYCDNYLEGFHIPFVHPALNQAIDFPSYTYELFPYCNLQLGIAKEGEPCFDIPKGSIDFGKNVYAYYFWVFPNMMFNFYPWGLSLNIVQPLSKNKTKISFRTYKFPNTTFNSQDNQLHITELEDEAVVESVQKGIQSGHYSRGRYAPEMEVAVHHFHQLIEKHINA